MTGWRAQSRRATTVSVSVRRNPKHMDRLILLGTAGGLRLLLPIGNSNQRVRRQPGDSLDIAVALVREAIDPARTATTARASCRSGPPTDVRTPARQRRIARRDTRAQRNPRTPPASADGVGARPPSRRRAHEQTHRLVRRRLWRPRRGYLRTGRTGLAASAPHMGEALESLVRLLEARVQLSAADETRLTIVLGDEASENAVEVLQRFDQTEGAAMLVVDRRCPRNLIPGSARERAGCGYGS